MSPRPLPRLAAGAVTTLLALGVAPSAGAATDPVVPAPAAAPGHTLVLRTPTGRTFASTALPLEVDTDGDGARDTLAYRLTLDPSLDAAQVRGVRVATGSPGARTTAIAARAATPELRLQLARAVLPGLPGIPVAEADQVVAQAAQTALWHEALGVSPAGQPYADARSAFRSSPGALAELYRRAYDALLDSPRTTQPSVELRVDQADGPAARLVAARRLAPPAPRPNPAPPAVTPAPAVTPVPTVTAAPSTSTTPPATSPAPSPSTPAAPPGTSPAPSPSTPAPGTPTAAAPELPAPSTSRPTASPAPAGPTAGASTGAAPSPTPTGGPSVIRRPPAMSPALDRATLPPANAALQPARASEAVVPVTIVLPGTGERRAVLGMPYALDLDGDSGRETTAFVMEPDVAVPTAPDVAIQAVPAWDSSSAPAEVPDPQDWSTIQGRVAAVAAAAAEPASRDELLRRAGIDLGDQPLEEVDQLVEQAAQVAIWEIGSGVRLSPDYRYAETVGVTGDRAALGDAFSTLVRRLVEDPTLVPPATATVYRVSTVRSARPTGGRASVGMRDGARLPSLVVGAQAAAVPAAQPQARPAPAAAAPMADQTAGQVAPRTVVTPVPVPPTVGTVVTPTTGTVFAPTTGTVVTAPGATTTGLSSCQDYAASGVTNIPTSDPRYRADLDPDHDGIACESSGQDQLARTGAELTWFALGGGLLIILGAALVRVGYVRRPVRVQA